MCRYGAAQAVGDISITLFACAAAQYQPCADRAGDDPVCTGLHRGRSGAFPMSGLGAQPPSPKLGQRCSTTHRPMLPGAPRLAIFPGLAITLAVPGLNMLGDGLRDVLDPRVGRQRQTKPLLEMDNMSVELPIGLKVADIVSGYHADAQSRRTPWRSGRIRQRRVDHRPCRHGGCPTRTRARRHAAADCASMGRTCRSPAGSRTCRMRGRRMAMTFQEPMTALNLVKTIGAQIAELIRSPTLGCESRADARA